MESLVVGRCLWCEEERVLDADGYCSKACRLVYSWHMEPDFAPDAYGPEENAEPPGGR